MTNKVTKEYGVINKLAFLASVLLICNLSALAAIDAYEFPNPELEARYQHLIDELRCPQCLNTNLAGSDAMVAQDLRREVHQQLLKGRSDEEILSFMHERYGDFILYRPRLMISTLILWLGPILVLMAGLLWLYRVIRISQSHTDAPVQASHEDQARIKELLEVSGNDNDAKGSS